MEAMDRTVVKRACDRFWSRLERIVAVEGAFIELTYSTAMLVSKNKPHLHYSCFGQPDESI